jgi:hypothetical protein
MSTVIARSEADEAIHRAAQKNGLLRFCLAGDMTDECSETWLTRQDRLDSSNKGASPTSANAPKPIKIDAGADG